MNELSLLQIEDIITAWLSEHMPEDYVAFEERIGYISDLIQFLYQKGVDRDYFVASKVERIMGAFVPAKTSNYAKNNRTKWKKWQEIVTKEVNAVVVEVFVDLDNFENKKELTDEQKEKIDINIAQKNKQLKHGKRKKKSDSNQTDTEHGTIYERQGRPFDFDAFKKKFGDDVFDKEMEIDDELVKAMGWEE